MKRVFYILCATMIIAACEKNNTPETENRSIYGRYTGTFNRSGFDTTEVEISLLTDNTFEGSAARPHYPAICSGHFSYDNANKVLTVNDTCTWTANFDWSLIFDENYNVEFSGINKLILWKTDGAKTDRYELFKLTR